LTPQSSQRNSIVARIKEHANEHRRVGGIKMNYRIYFTTLACLVLVGSPAWAVVTIDRDYRLGDATEEAVVFDGLEVGTNFEFNGDKFTADSMNQGAPNFYDAQDLQAFGAPVYRDVSARPIISSGFG